MTLSKWIVAFLYTMLFLHGCKSNTINQSFDNIIIGEWQLCNEIQGETKFDPFIRNVTFKENSKCNIYPSFYSYLFEDPRTFITYLGSNTDFKYEDNLLKIFNLSSKNWDQFEIKKLSSDTLIIETTSEKQLIFKRVAVREEFDNDIEEIILITNGLNKHLSDYKTYLDRSGKMLIELNGYDDLYGHQTCLLDKRVTDSIFSLFKYNKIFELKNEYIESSYGSISQTEPKQKNNLAFFNDNRIMKEIEILDDNTPIELFMAYDPIRTIYKSKDCHCKPLKNNNEIVTLSSEIQTSDEKGYLKISDAELFYLNIKVLNAKEIRGSIQQKYKIKGSFTDLFTFSDGRYIRLEGSEKIYDVGYWFIDSTKMSFH